jgi:hypothetical protein
LPELTELDEEGQRIRLTDAGQIIADYTQGMFHVKHWRVK